MRMVNFITSQVDEYFTLNAIVWMAKVLQNKNFGRVYEGKFVKDDFVWRNIPMEQNI